MVHRRGPRAWARAGAIVLLPAVAACSTVDSSTSDSPAAPVTAEPRGRRGAAPVDPSLQLAAVRAADALAGMRGEMDPASLSIPDYLARRYGLAALDGSGNLARRLLVAGDRRGTGSATDGLVESTARRPTRGELAGSPGYERAIVSARFCDRLEGRALARRVTDLAGAGGYPLTHAAFAFQLAWERHCFDDITAVRTARVLVTALRTEVAKMTVVDDLAIERLAMLAFLGRPLPPNGVAAIADAQRPDGSWSDLSGEVLDWHPTMLGTWVLAAASSPGRTVPFLANTPRS